MTLILTAVCKDGIAVCADKRRTVKTAQSTMYHDDLDKIYRFKGMNVMMFNHGINVICQKDWRSYCSEFESTRESQELSFDKLVDDFKSFMEVDVEKELSTNEFDDTVGFVFCAAADNGELFVRELFWKRSCSMEDNRHRGLVRTGNSAGYLRQYITNHPEVDTVDYWAGLRTSEAINELKLLFEEAVKRRDEESGQEFSETFDIHELRS